MMGEQMDLFDIKATTAEIIAFPIDRHLVYVRKTARHLEQIQGPAADRFWKGECRRLRDRLKAQGMDEPAIRSELDRFAIAVHREMQQAAWNEWYAGNGGDAA